MKCIVTLLLALLLVGCGEPRIDGSSEMAFEVTSRRMVQSRPEAEREELEAAITRLLFAAMFDPGGNQQQNLQAMRQKLDGMNAEQVMTFAVAEDRRQLVMTREAAEAEVVAASAKLRDADLALAEAPDDESLAEARHLAEEALASAQQEVDRRSEQISKLDRGEDW